MSDLLIYNYIHNPAELTQEAQELSSAVFRMRGLPELKDAHNVLIAHCLFAGKTKTKATMMEMDKNRYWLGLDRAHVYLAARIDQASIAIAS